MSTKQNVLEDRPTEAQPCVYCNSPAYKWGENVCESCDKLKEELRELPDVGLLRIIGDVCHEC